MPETNDDASSRGIYSVLNRLIGIVGWILFVPIFSMFTLIGFYIWSVFERSSNSMAAAEDIKEMLATFWQNVKPIAVDILASVVPILILLVVVGLLKWASPEKWFNAENLKDNLPSVIALIVIVTVCILAVSGNTIPHTLNSIGLVVIGYYFGKVKA
ncbi:hypothetical protein QLG06_04985 [Pseudomonas sp. V104_6]|uniref:hypothetical protein n=1 Tax=Pseudomonas sp. V104_6 TaxID=3044230 RepID=UPI00249E37D1|nr:hypothetical protein [Pseudomonas sp. V104_6]MDI3373706.1 hypothetical protein [Pseudomonas sp. V104_6]